MKIDSIEKTLSVALADQARRLKSSGKNIIELQTGDPDFSTHQDIITAANKAMLGGYTHYSFSSGLPTLRECIANMMNQEFTIRLTSENVLISQGAVQGIFSALSALVELGDEVIILEPNWSTVDSIVTMCGGLPIKISHLVEDSELFESLEQCLGKKTKILCINSPNNPTGRVFSKYRVQRLVEWCQQHDLYLVSDEVYRSIVFGCVHTSVMSYYQNNERLVFIDSFSKKYAMTGWRVGFVIAHNSVLEKISKASQIQITHVAPFIQFGAIEALKNANVNRFVNTMLQQYSERRSLLVDLCHNLGLKLIVPDGAFYLFIYIGEGSVSYCEKLLYEYSICVIPGIAYGLSGENFIRLTFAAETDKIVAALKVISRTLMEK